MSVILVVCTGNICRSPVGEAVLTELLPDGFVVVSSGTHAAVGVPATAEAVGFVQREVGVVLKHVGRQLAPEEVEVADLVLTMTLEQRAWVVRMSPLAVRRTFTLRELALIVGYPGLAGEHGQLRDFALEASRFRFQAGIEGEVLDIEDPYGGTPRDYQRSFDEVLDASRKIAAFLGGQPAEERSGGSGTHRKVIPFRTSGGQASGSGPP